MKVNYTIKAKGMHDYEMHYFSTEIDSGELPPVFDSFQQSRKWAVLRYLSIRETVVGAVIAGVLSKEEAVELVERAKLPLKQEELDAIKQSGI